MTKSYDGVRVRKGTRPQWPLPLSLIEEQVLATGVQERCLPAPVRAEARNRLLLHNMRWINKRLQAYADGLSPDDQDELRSLVVVKVLDSIENFHPYGTRLISYLPVHRIIAYEREKLKGSPTLRLNHEPRYSAQIDSDEDLGPPVHWAEKIADPNAVAPDETAENAVEAARLRLLVDAIPERDRRIVRLRIGDDGEEPMTYEQIAKDVDLTRERVRQRFIAACKSLRTAYIARNEEP